MPLFLDKGAASAMIDRADKDGYTSLIVDCQNGHAAIASLLLDKGAAINLANKSGAPLCGTPAA